MLDYIRIACAVPAVQVADAKQNTRDICDKIAEAENAGCDLVVFPELALTGYTCADLFFQETLLNSAAAGLGEICEYTRKFPTLTVAVGLPLVIGGQMYNCGAVVSNGRIHGIVPKTYLPNYKEFYERRWFSSSEDLQRNTVSARDLGLEADYEIPVGRDIVFKLGDGVLFGVEICEDLWTPMPPSTMLTLNGAAVGQVGGGFPGQIMDAGGGVGFAVLHPGAGTVAAIYRGTGLGIQNIVLAEMDAGAACVGLHYIHLFELNDYRILNL